MNNEQLIKRIEELENWKKSLEASHSLPLNVFQAFSARLNAPRLEYQVEKAASSESQTLVDEGSNVLREPDGFDRKIEDGVTKYYPWYNLS